MIQSPVIRAVFNAQAARVGGNDANTKMLLHFDNNLVDSSRSNRTITAFGSVVTSTAWSMFGGYSILFDGTDDYITVPDSGDFALGTSDFTFDWWMRPVSVANAGMFHTRDDVNNRMYCNIDATNIYFFANSGGVSLASYQAAHGLAANTPAHIALVRKGSGFFIFKDGVALPLTVTTAIGTNSLPDLADVFAIGRYFDSAQRYFSGYMDEFRFSNIARYSTNFVPQTSAYA